MHPELSTRYITLGTDIMTMLFILLACCKSREKPIKRLLTCRLHVIALVQSLVITARLWADL